MALMLPALSSLRRPKTASFLSAALRWASIAFLPSIIFFTFGEGSAAPIFSSPFRSSDAARGAADVVIADLNADGISDLVVPAFNSNSVSVMLGNGDGTFGARRDYRTGGGPFCVSIGNVDE